MKIILETPRLILREKSRSDAANMMKLNSNPFVIQYTNDKAFNSITEAEEVIEDILRQYELYAYGRWAVELKDTGEYIGWCGLKFHPDEIQTEIGYRFAENFWNRGFATEAAKACLQYGFDQFKLPEIYAHAMKANIASIKVIEKLGMKRVNGETSHCSDGLVYKIEKQ